MRFEIPPPVRVHPLEVAAVMALLAVASGHLPTPGELLLVLAVALALFRWQAHEQRREGRE